MKTKLLSIALLAICSMLVSCNKEITLMPATGDAAGGLNSYVALTSPCTLKADGDVAELNVTLHALQPGQIQGSAEITFQLLNELGKPIHEDAFVKLDPWQGGAQSTLKNQLAAGMDANLTIRSSIPASVWSLVKEHAKQVKIVASKADIPYIIHLDGAVAQRYKMEFDLRITGDKVRGTSFYKSSGPNNRMHNKGDYQFGKLVLEDYNPKGRYIGYYEGSFDGQTYKGTYYNEFNGNVLPFELTLAEGGEFVEDPDFEYGPRIIYQAYDEFSFGNGSWDAFLDEYEEYVDRYITVLRKANNGDPNAIAEAAGLMVQLGSMQEEAEHAGMPTMSQLQRLNRINHRWEQAAMNF